MLGVLLVDEVDGVLEAVELEVLLLLEDDESDEVLELALFSLLPDFALLFDEP